MWIFPSFSSHSIVVIPVDARRLREDETCTHCAAAVEAASKMELKIRKLAASWPSWCENRNPFQNA